MKGPLLGGDTCTGRAGPGSGTGDRVRVHGARKGLVLRSEEEPRPGEPLASARERPAGFEARVMSGLPDAPSSGFSVTSSQSQFTL